MLSLEDCIDYLKLWREEVEPLAAHDYPPSVVEAEVRKYATRSAAGKPMLERVILDDMSEALADDDFQVASRLLATMRHFVEHHPDNPRVLAPRDDFDA